MRIGNRRHQQQAKRDWPDDVRVGDVHANTATAFGGVRPESQA